MKSAEKFARLPNHILFDYTTWNKPNIKTMNALTILAERTDDMSCSDLLDLISAVAKYSGFSYIFGGIPMGYPAAAKLFKKGGVFREKLLDSVEILTEDELESLMNWLEPLERQD